MKHPAELQVPLVTRASWKLWAWITWPLEVRQLKREGWQRTGWMTWESPEADADAVPHQH